MAALPWESISDAVLLTSPSCWACLQAAYLDSMGQWEYLAEVVPMLFWQYAWLPIKVPHFLYAEAPHILVDISSDVLSFGRCWLMEEIRPAQPTCLPLRVTAYLHMALEPPFPLF